METESACPFCGAAIEERAAARLLDGRLSRAAVFAGAVLAAPACYVQNPPPPAYYPQQPPPPPDYSNQDPSYAQPPPDYGQQAPLGTGIIRGRVLDSSGTPQPGIRIELRGQQAFVATTDGSGAYFLSGVPEGQYTMMVGSGPYRTITALANREQIINVSIAPQVQTPYYDRNNIPKPYGAPPARKRIV